MRMCGINQVHGGFTHEHTHRVYILHTLTQRAIQTLKPCQWRLKAFRKVFDLSISIVCFIAHIFYAVYAQNSVRSLAHVLVTIAHKVENSLEPNISESLHVCSWVCLWPVVRGPAVWRRLQRDCWRCSGKTALRHIMRAEIPDLRQYSQSEGWERNRKRNAQCLHST